MQFSKRLVWKLRSLTSFLFINSISRALASWLQELRGFGEQGLLLSSTRFAHNDSNRQLSPPLPNDLCPSYLKTEWAHSEWRTRQAQTTLPDSEESKGTFNASHQASLPSLWEGQVSGSYPYPHPGSCCDGLIHHPWNTKGNRVSRNVKTFPKSQPVRSRRRGWSLCVFH